MYYTITLLNDSLDKSTAEVVLYNANGAYQLAVVSRNKKMQSHLEKLLTSEYHVISPGKIQPNEATVSVLDVQPYTLEYFQLVPEILSWRGYRSTFHNEVYKSMDLMEDFMVLKSTEIYNNSKGERIVKHVPQGYVAVNVDGRTVAGGRYLNANIDKEGAEWYLVENPHEAQTPDEREDARSEWELGVGNYHPGFDEDMYNHRSEDDDAGEYHRVQEEGWKPEGKTLKEFFGEMPVDKIEDTLEKKEISLPAHLPPKLAENVLVYSPDLNVAFDSKFWPPLQISGFENADWYAYDYPEVDETEYDDIADLIGMNPQLIKGTRNSIVKVTDEMDSMGEGTRLNLDPGESGIFDAQEDNQTIVINRPVTQPFSLDDYDDQTFATQLQLAKESTERWKAFTKYKDESGRTGVSPEADNIKIPELRGIHARFLGEPRNYQKPIIKALVEPKQYEIYGGPRGYFGHYLNLSYGAGKTPTVLAAEAVLRNQGKLKNGHQVSIVTAPSKNIHVWRTEIEKFRGENALVIDGYKADRIRQWESILELARKGELPNFIVVSGSKFRHGSETYEDDDGDEKKELGLDAKYMKLLALGGKSQGKSVEGGHLGLMVLDETGNYVNAKSSRYAAVNEITEAVYYGKGLVWTLNGDLSGNSASDTVSEVSFINMHAKYDYSELVKRYTVHDDSRPHSDARKWKPGNALPQFMDKFRGSIYSLNGQTIAGDEYGLEYTPDLETPLGKNWGSVYSDTLEKMELVMDAGSGKPGRALGMLGILIGASYGAVQPQRLLEYDIGTDVFLPQIRSLMDQGSYDDFREELRGFLRDVTEETVDVGRLPKEKVTTQARDEAYNRHFSQSSRNTMERVLEMWDNPALEEIMKGIDDAIKSSKGKPIKLGVAGFSKRAIQSLYRRLKNEYTETSTLVMKFDGDTSSEEISKQQLAHQSEKDKNVISLVTGAGLYGLSLAAERGWVFATWNPAKLGQYGGRYHRSPTQKSTLTVVVPSGTSQYIRQVEQRKKDIQEYARAELMDINISDDGEIVEANQKSAMRLIDKLKHYYPKILKEESRDAT